MTKYEIKLFLFSLMIIVINFLKVLLLIGYLTVLFLVGDFKIENIECIRILINPIIDFTNSMGVMFLFYK